MESFLHDSGFDDFQSLQESIADLRAKLANAIAEGKSNNANRFRTKIEEQGKIQLDALRLAPVTSAVTSILNEIQYDDLDGLVQDIEEKKIEVKRKVDQNKPRDAERVSKELDVLKDALERICLSSSGAGVPPAPPADRKRAAASQMQQPPQPDSALAAPRPTSTKPSKPSAQVWTALPPFCLLFHGDSASYFLSCDVFSPNRMPRPIPCRHLLRAFALHHWRSHQRGRRGVLTRPQATAPRRITTPRPHLPDSPPGKRPRAWKSPW